LLLAYHTFAPETILDAPDIAKDYLKLQLNNAQNCKYTISMFTYHTQINAHPIINIVTIYESLLKSLIKQDAFVPCGPVQAPGL